LLRRREEIEALWNACTLLARENNLPERCASALIDAAYGLRIRRGSYQTAVEGSTGEEISKQTATRDLTTMVERDLLNPVGERRSRYYLAGIRPTELLAHTQASRPRQTDEDPFVVVRDRRQLSLT
jgi:hypothetical protein